MVGRESKTVTPLMAIEEDALLCGAASRPDLLSSIFYRQSSIINALSSILNRPSSMSLASRSMQ